jgi:Transposase IS4
MPSRPMNKGRSNDHDFVPPTKYKPSSRNQKLPEDVSPLEIIPKFNAMDINNTKGSAQLPDGIDGSSPEALFSLFFTSPIIDLIAQCTNFNAERARIDPVASRAKNIRFPNSLNQKPWKPVTADEILAYLGIEIYMGIYTQPHINDYWNTNDEKKPLHPSVRKSMSYDRWKQINRYFHVWDPTSSLFERPAGDEKVRPHEKVGHLGALLKSSFQRYWKPGTHVAVDECIEGFTGRSADTVNIPTKPTPIGFKIWVLADQGYVLDFLWHVKGDGKDQGPQGLSNTWEKKGFSKTQSVVLELVTRMPNGGRGHVVHLDNLFTSSKLLSTLRDYGIGANGTVRTGKTKREEKEEQAPERDPEFLDPARVQDQEPSLRPALDLVDEIRGDMHQALLGKTQPQQPAVKGKKPEKEKNFGMNNKLTELKIKWSNHIAWGKLYGCLSPDRKVLQLAWKDSQVVLFMTTISDAQTGISRVRKRPNGKDKWVRAEFGDLPFKRLEIPEFIDLYNHFMNGVDRADQIRSYYRSNHRNYRTWKPLWYNLLHVTICNAALIWMDRGFSSKQKGGHLDFRIKLASQLMSHSSSHNYTCPIDGFGVQTNLKNHVIASLDTCGGVHEVLSKVAKECKACMAQGRTTQAGWKRKALQELSVNSAQINEDGERSRIPRPPRTRYGCSVCQIRLCQLGPCWEEHIQQSKLVL